MILKKLIALCLVCISAMPVAAFAQSGGIPVMNGVNVDICLIDPGSNDYVKNASGQDLIEIAAGLGINIFRITDHACTNHKDHSTTPENLRKILLKMNQYNIRALFTTEPPTTNGKITPDSVRFITSMVIDNKLGTYPNVYGVDVINEPTLDDDNIAAIKQAITQIKSVYPHLRISVGGWKTQPGYGACPASAKGYCWNKAEDGKAFSGLLDYYSAHIYGFDKPKNGTYPDPYQLTAYYLNTMMPFTEGKPIFIEEYGAANGLAVTDQKTTGSAALQANVTDGVLRAVKAYQGKNVVGSTQWVLYSRNAPKACGWELLYDNGNKAMPAAYVIKKYTTN